MPAAKTKTKPQKAAKAAKVAKAAAKSTVSRVAADKRSRADRWQAAVAIAVVARGDLDDAISTLADLRDEFEQWRDNVPENLHGSVLYEKLDAICDLDIDRDAALDPLDFLDDADGIDIPLGYGRD